MRTELVLTPFFVLSLSLSSSGRIYQFSRWCSRTRLAVTRCRAVCRACCAACVIALIVDVWKSLSLLETGPTLVPVPSVITPHRLLA